MRFLLVLLVACGASHHPKPVKLGAITGLVRDATSSVSLAQVDVELGDKSTASSAAGVYLFDNLPPGQYTLHSRYASQPITVEHIQVDPGTATYVDIAFTLGDLAPIVIDWARTRGDEIQQFKALVPRIEGTVGDSNTRTRVAGAVVTAALGEQTLQTITDDDGRYRFDNVDPGSYAISAYYSIGGRAQIEVRRSDVVVKTGGGVYVPLWIELTK